MKQFVIHAWDGNDEKALERRMAARPGHFSRAKELKASGNFVIGGAMLDDSGKMIGSTMIVQFESETELQAWLDADPYMEGKVWENVRVYPFRVADV